MSGTVTYCRAAGLMSLSSFPVLMNGTGKSKSYQAIIRAEDDQFTPDDSSNYFGVHQLRYLAHQDGNT